METEVAATFYNAKEALPFRVTLVEMGNPQPPTHMEVDNETAIGFLKITINNKNDCGMSELVIILRILATT